MKHLLTLALSALLVGCNAGTNTPYPATNTPTVQTIITNGQVLTIERSQNEYAAYGSVSIPRNHAGLANALALKAEVDALVIDLSNQKALGALH
jgi:hypothetical protein